MTRWIDRMAYKYRRFGIDNLMLYITASTLMVYLAQNLTGMPLYQLLALDRARVMRGQIWRLVTFIFLPAHDMILWVLLSLYFYYFIGNTLENTWGRTKFTIFYLFGMLGAVIAAFISGYGSNWALNMSLFLAVAILWPDHEILLFFAIPVKLKILAYIDLVLLALMFISGGLPEKASIILSFLNIALFFGDELYGKLRDFWKYRKTRNNYRKSMKRQRDMYGN